MTHDDARTLWTPVTTSAAWLGVVHALVDMGSGFLVFRDLGHGRFLPSTVIALVLLYNGLAFAGQAPLGWLLDRAGGGYRRAALLGALLVATALLLAPASALLGVVVIGLGNALFHVGAGARVLRASGRRAADSGVFVGPGAVGLFVGLWLGGGDVAVRLPLALALGTAAVVLSPLARPALDDVDGLFERALPRPPRAAWLLVVVGVFCLAGSVTVRSLVGGTISGAWRGESTTVLALLAGMACAGKMAGGFLGDRVGWLASSAIALPLSAPLIVLWVELPAAAVVGMLLFQLTMPVTLKATHHLLPGRPGLAFGLPCLALYAGALPGLLRAASWASAPAVVAGAMALSLVMIVVGLRLLPRAGAAGGPRSAPAAVE